MMAVLYVMTAGLSAGAFGLFTYEVMSRQGFVPDSQAGLMIAAAAACIYAGSQAAYITFVRLFHPTRDWQPFLLDMVSHLTALLFIPYILEWSIAWPHPILEPIAPALFLAAFVVVHSALKLVSYYAFVSGRPSDRLGGLGWAALTAALLYGGWTSYGEWLNAFTRATPSAPEGTATYRIGPAYGEARVLPEGVTVEYPVTAEGDTALTFRFALPPERPAGLFGESPVVYVNLTAIGEEAESDSMRLRLDEGRWGTLRLQHERLPEGTKAVQVLWTSEEDPPWQRFLPFRPLVDSQRELLIGGPYEHRSRTEDTPQNIIIIAVDSLGADHMSYYGYPRETTPNLDRLARERLAFEAAYTPAPDNAAAAMTVLTGLRPERHAFYGASTGELPERIPTLAERFRNAGYVTAAFTEAEGDREPVMLHGTGYARGFDWFDPSYRRDAQVDDMEAGSRQTIAKVRDFIEAHADVAFFVFARVRELSDLRPRARYGEGYVAPGANQPDPRDVYDTALTYLDEQVGGFVQYVRDYDFRTNTAVFVTGTHGLTFREDAAPGIGLTEPCLRVPLFAYILGEPRESREDYVGLEDIAPTAMAMAQLEADDRLDGANLLAEPRNREPVAMQRGPLAWSMRAGKWRSVWMPAETPEEERFALYDLDRRPPENRARYNPGIVRRHRQELYTLYQLYQNSAVAGANAGAAVAGAR